MHTLSMDDKEALATLLTEAGENWQAVAAELPETDKIFIGDDKWRDRVTLIPQLELGGTFHDVTLYRIESGIWHSTGWSDAGKSPQRLMRPSGVRYDADAGVHVRDTTGDV